MAKKRCARCSQRPFPYKYITSRAKEIEKVPALKMGFGLAAFVVFAFIGFVVGSWIGLIIGIFLWLVAAGSIGL